MTTSFSRSTSVSVADASWYSTLSPAFSMAAITSGSFIVLSSAAERRSTIGFGVLAGAYSSIHVLSEASGWRFSVIVGVLGITGRRLPALVARATRSPERTTDSTALSAAAPIGTWPPSSAFFTGPEPLKGTCDRVIPYACCSSSMLK